MCISCVDRASYVLSRDDDYVLTPMFLYTGRGRLRPLSTVEEDWPCRSRGPNLWSPSPS